MSDVLFRIQAQATRPRAFAAGGLRHLVGEKRAIVLWLVVQHPALPVVQCRRHILRQQRHGKKSQQNQ